MDFTPSQDRQMLAETFARHLDQRYPISTRHQISGSSAGWSREPWRTMAELGVSGEHVELLHSAIAGEAVLALACEEPQNRYDWSRADTRAREQRGAWILNGQKSVVSQLEAASHVLVSASLEAGRVGLFLVESGSRGAAVRGYRLIDGGRGGELALTETPATLVSEHAADLLEETVAAGIVALSWEAVGVMDVLKKSTLDYLRTRKQFGIPIGKFQALQHRMVNLAIEIEQARSAAINAAAALDAPREARERAAAAAKYTVNRVGALVAEECIQLHGGIGMSRELPLSHYAKRAVLIGHQLGDEDHHLQRYMDLVRAA